MTHTDRAEPREYTRKGELGRRTAKRVGGSLPDLLTFSDDCGTNFRGEWCRPIGLGATEG
ncbi:MAG: hypothetical protein JWO52_1253 [Gammaproteobacteria bacterium]|jgi:hypothetical protein|nr:hypothetical protein [Gammaproteobacteria bacterium]